MVDREASDCWRWTKPRQKRYGFSICLGGQDDGGAVWEATHDDGGGSGPDQIDLASVGTGVAVSAFYSRKEKMGRLPPACPAVVPDPFLH